MEYLDILDEKGNKTGESKPYDEVHQKGLWHYAVHIWFINSRGELLLQRRSKNKVNYPDMWDISAAGHVSSGENPTDSAVREVKEEIGADISVNQLQKIGEFSKQAVLNSGTYVDNEYDIVYLVDSDIGLEKLKMQESEVSDLRYVAPKEFKKWIEEKTNPVVPNPKEYKLLFEHLKV